MAHAGTTRSIKDSSDNDISTATTTGTDFGGPQAPLPGTLDVYMQQLKHLAPLSADRQMALARAYAAGDKDAGRQLVATNLRLVVKLAREYSKTQSELLELIQEGGLGMAVALERFDPDKGTKFTSYAQYWVRARILDFLINRGRTIRLGGSRAGRKIFYNLARARRAIEHAGHDATTERLAEELDVSERDIVQVATQMEHGMVLLDEPLEVGSGDTLRDTIPAPDACPEHTAAEREIRHQFEDVLADFSHEMCDARERDIWHDRVLADSPKTLRELGEEWGVSKERIRQVEVDMRNRLAARFKQSLETDHPTG
jgi:RNA polymerase sigma-32 factor